MKEYYKKKGSTKGAYYIIPKLFRNNMSEKYVLTLSTKQIKKELKERFLD